ncbi:hypothetical protein JCM5353_006410 [Sporobolomyces roseus]
MNTHATLKEELLHSTLSSAKVQLARTTCSLLPLVVPSKSRPSSRQVRSSRPSTSSVPLCQPPNGLSAPSLSSQTIKGYPCVYTKEYQEYYVKGMAKLEKGKGKEWSIKKREFKVMKEWEKEWRKRNGSENGAEQASISQDKDLSENGAALAKSVVEEKSLNLPSQQNSIPSLLLNPPSSSDSSSSSSDLDFAPDALGLHPNHLPSSFTHAIHSEVRKIYEHPKEKSTSFMLDPQQGFVEVEVEIEEGGQKHMHWLEQGNEGGEGQEKQRNLEDEMDEEENEDYLFQEDRQQKMGSLLERIGDKHESEEGEGEREEEEGEQGEIGEKSKENEEILEMSVTTVQGVVEMEEDEDSEEASEKSQELEGQLRQTLASSNLLQQLKDNYRCDCYDDDDDQEMMKGITGGDEYGMGIEGGLNSNSEEEEEGDDSDSLSHPNSLQHSHTPAPQPASEEHSTISEEAKSNKLKNLKKKEQKKRKKEEKKRAKLAEELEKVKGEKRKAVDEVISTEEGGLFEQKKRKRKSEKGKGLNA